MLTKERKIIMNIVDLTNKKITANSNGLIITDYGAVHNAVFLANLPKSAVVDHIKVDGKFLEDINTKKIRYHIEPKEFIKDTKEWWKTVATVWFEEDDLELYEKLASCEVQDFEVFYHLEYAHECHAISEVD
jgi:predicted HNH restriction endonuclease